MRLSVNPKGVQKVYSKLSALLSWLYPPLCTLCDARGLPGLDICEGCYNDLPWNRHACLQCALPLPPDSKTVSLCSHCLKSGPETAYDQVWAAFIYSDPLPWLIAQLKFHQQLNHARLLAELMWSTLRTPLLHQPAAAPDLIMPIPLHNKRLRERGFNQSLEIARPLARYSGIAMDSHSLARCKNTQRQSDLNQHERHKNLRQAFVCRDDLSGLHVALIDDVMTSGSTVNAAAKALKCAGARQVSVWVAARAALHAT